MIPFSNAQVEKLAKGETVRQIQQAAPPLKGKVASHYMHYEWQADLIDWTTAPSSSVNKKMGEVHFDCPGCLLSLHMGGGLGR